MTLRLRSYALKYSDRAASIRSSHAFPARHAALETLRISAFRPEGAVIELIRLVRGDRGGCVSAMYEDRKIRSRDAVEIGFPPRSELSRAPLLLLTILRFWTRARARRAYILVYLHAVLLLAVVSPSTGETGRNAARREISPRISVREISRDRGTSIDRALLARLVVFRPRDIVRGYARGSSRVSPDLASLSLSRESAQVSRHANREHVTDGNRSAPCFEDLSRSPRSAVPKLIRAPRSGEKSISY